MEHVGLVPVVVHRPGQPITVGADLEDADAGEVVALGDHVLVEQHLLRGSAAVPASISVGPEPSSGMRQWMG